MHRRHVTYPQGREATQYRPKGIMLKSIAWATDGSPSARQAFTVAKELARVHESRLLILHVQETGITRARLLADANDHITVGLERVVEQLRTTATSGRAVPGVAGYFVPRRPHHQWTQKWVLIPMAPQSPTT